MLYCRPIRKGGAGMTEEQFEREKNYQITLAIARTMLANSILTTEDLSVIETMLREKYRPLLGSLAA